MPLPPIGQCRGAMSCPLGQGASGQLPLPTRTISKLIMPAPSTRLALHATCAMHYWCSQWCQPYACAPARLIAHFTPREHAYKEAYLLSENPLSTTVFLPGKSRRRDPLLHPLPPTGASPSYDIPFLMHRSQSTTKAWNHSRSCRCRSPINEAQPRCCRCPLLVSFCAEPLPCHTPFQDSRNEASIRVPMMFHSHV
jgi:hypothetical protein